MRQVADDPDEAARRGKAAREHILRTRSLEAAAKWMRQELESAYRNWQNRPSAPTGPEHPLAPMQRATQALHWRPETGGPARLPLAPALRKVVLRAIDHYDVHQRRVMGELFGAVEDTVGRLLSRIEALEASGADIRERAEKSRKFDERLESLTGQVDRLNIQSPGTELALRNLEAGVAGLSEALDDRMEAVHEMFSARDQRREGDPAGHARCPGLPRVRPTGARARAPGRGRGAL
jgi:hypothetical protein